jgi:hypothetical protein
VQTGIRSYCKAMLHGDMSDGPGVLDLTGAGLRQQGSLSPKPRVLLLQQAAHGVSLLGGHSAEEECARLLDEAAGLVDAVEDDYPWGGNCRTPYYVDVQPGHDRRPTRPYSQSAGLVGQGNS